MYTNKNEFISLGKPLCLKHLIHKDDSKQVASKDVKLFICAFSEWTIMTDTEYENVKEHIPEECHLLYLKKYDKILWKMYEDHKCEMPFILIPEISTVPKLKFQWYETIDKDIYIHLFTTIFEKLRTFIKDSVDKFNINIIDDKLDNTKVSFYQVLINALAYSQGSDYSLAGEDAPGTGELSFKALRQKHLTAKYAKEVPQRSRRRSHLN